MLRWPVHLLVQLLTFAVFPLLWLLAAPLVSAWMPAGLALGFAICVPCRPPSRHRWR